MARIDELAEQDNEAFSGIDNAPEEWLQNFVANTVYLNSDYTWNTQYNSDRLEEEYPRLSYASKRVEDYAAWVVDYAYTIANYAEMAGETFADIPHNQIDSPDWVKSREDRNPSFFTALDIASIISGSPKAVSKETMRAGRLASKLEKIGNEAVEIGEKVIDKESKNMPNLNRLASLAKKVGVGAGKTLGRGALAVGSGALGAIGFGSIQDSIKTAIKLSESETFPVHAGSSNGGIAKLNSDGYAFTAILCSPTKRDIQALDDFFSAYGYAVNKWGTPKIDFSKNKGNNACFYLKVGDSCCTSSIREAQLQLDSMCMSGCRFWKKEIGQA